MAPPTSNPCPDLETLVSLADGRLLPSRRNALEDHLAECALCRRIVSAAADCAPAATPRTFSFNWRIASAAAGLLALLAGAGWWLGRGEPSRPPVSGERLPPAFTGELATGPSETRAISLPDGSILRAGPLARLRLLPSQEGERWRVRLDSGEVEAAVAPGKAAARIVSEAGEIRILGTRFRARAFRIRLPAGAEDALYVKLEEGKVAVGNARGSLQLLPSGVALAVAGTAPIQMEGSPDAATSLRELGTIVIRAKDGSLQVAPGKEHPAWILAGSLWGEWGPGLLSKAGDDPVERLGAQAAAALCASQEELAEVSR